MASNAYVLGDIRSAKTKIMLMIPKGRINADYAKTILDEVYKQKNNKCTAHIYLISFLFLNHWISTMEMPILNIYFAAFLRLR